ncbi:DUF1501 domain-containing protein [Wenzhouxiangella marina]|uniref:Uncharacterized protein n=1 Tax=Wenzhouxiangella marina TaxID=1579979 RepID=A0A0K0Y094_9GAMM|nr:DUF1501 domain-containing protein [Wenzhouxiangella marina]AKS43286.1 hypothetical protein WM2015_2931 [Wenzhouxiangella marina]MBB6087024.1 uncharacterized protein (DUF1501 family) [Wenzhouxiangella marina]
MKRRSLKEIKAALTRRQFLKLTGATAGAATMNLSFAPRALAGGGGQKVLVYLFLRGGIDGLALLPPINGSDHTHLVDARDRTLVNIDDSDPARRPIPLANGQNLGLHPWCGGLADIYHDGGMAIVQAAGHPPNTFTRSHFDAQEQIELGQPLVVDGTGQGLPGSGWLTRYLGSYPGVPAPGAIFTAMVSNNTPPVSLGGWPDVATLDSPDNFMPNTGTFGSTQLAMLSSLYAGAGELDVAAGAALDAIDLINSIDFGSYVPGGGAVYPNTSEGNDLKLIAQLIRQDLGIAAATLDVGGWDTHNNQNVFGFGFGTNVEDLSEALTAFYRDLEGAGYINDVAVVVQSEFGRQVKENASFGTDHGLGNPMFILGGGVNGGQVYGPTLGIAPADRIGDSLVPQTDFRDVLAEVATGLLGHPDVSAIFDDPDYSYSPVGFSV